MADYARSVHAEDVFAAAAHWPAPARRRLAQRLAPGTPVHDLDALLAQAPPEGLGVNPGAWVAAFSPLFGEFE